MPERQKFLEDARESLRQSVQTWVQAHASWREIRNAASGAGETERVSKAEQRMLECEERMAAVQLRLTEIEAQLAAMRSGSQEASDSL